MTVLLKDKQVLTFAHGYVNGLGEVIAVFKSPIEHGDEEVEECFGLLEVCGRCMGSGVHDPEAFSGGLTAEDFRDDPEFEQEYFAGRYDVNCTECDAQKIDVVIDYERLEREDPELLKEIEGQEYADSRAWQESEGERRMGA